MALLLWLLYTLPTSTSAPSFWRRIATPAAFSIVALGVGLWFVAVGIESIFPPLSVSAGWPTPQTVASLFTVPVLPVGEEELPTAAMYDWSLPAGFPLPRTPADNPMTAAKVELGRYLFYDTRLSGNGTQSCESCHYQALAFSDGKITPQGSTGEMLERNSPALVNVAYYATLTWANPVLTELERQVLVPLFGEFPVEMGVTGREEEVLARLQENERYQELFVRRLSK